MTNKSKFSGWIGSYRSVRWIVIVIAVLLMMLLFLLTLHIGEIAGKIFYHEALQSVIL